MGILILMLLVLLTQEHSKWIKIVVLVHKESEQAPAHNLKNVLNPV